MASKNSAIQIPTDTHLLVFVFVRWRYCSTADVEKLQLNCAQSTPVISITTAQESIYLKPFSNECEEILGGLRRCQAGNQ